MIKIALFDVDGVIVAPRKEYFTDRLVREFGVSAIDSKEFVQNVLLPAFVGSQDLRMGFQEYLQHWQIAKSVDEMFDYWWAAESTIQHEVLEEIRRLRQSGTKVFLASDQEKYRAEYLMNEMKLKQEVDGAFFSYQIGVQKHDPTFFKQIMTELKVADPSEIVYLDDDQKNVEVALGVGIDARLFTDLRSLQSNL